MEHRVVGAKFGRSRDHRAMMLRNLLTSLVKEGSVTTTEAKAKALKALFDKLVTRAKKQTLASRRYVEAELLNKEASKNLVEKIVPGLEGRVSGYTNLQRLGKRPGDKAEKLKVSIVSDIQ